MIAMKWGFEIALILFLLVIWFVLRREGFDPNDPALMAAIQAVAPPGANLTTYVKALQDFDETVFKYSDLPITMQSIQYYIVQQKIQPTDAEPLKKLMADRYLGKKKETMLPVEVPVGLTYPAEPLSDIVKPERYESNDKDPVLPKSKPMFQRQSLDRGGGNTNVAAYSWDLANYKQDSVEGLQGIALARVPKLSNMREGFSSMAGAVTSTNDVYGPRIPKTRGAVGLAGPVADDPSQMYPPLYGPGNPYGGEKQIGLPIGDDKKDTPAKTNTSCNRPPGASSVGDLDVNKVTTNEALADSMTGGCGGPACDPWVGMTIPKDMAKTEPVPFLGDFSKFFR